jgi:hypothetical protein
MVTPCGGKFRRGNHVFVTWKGDHRPRHVHVFRDGKLVVRWNLERNVAMEGHADARVRWLIALLRREGRL